MKKLENRHMHDCIALFFNVQSKRWAESLVCSVIKSCPYSSLQRREKNYKKKRLNAEYVMDVFFALVRFRLEERVSLSSVVLTLSPLQFDSPSFRSVGR